MKNTCILLGILLTSGCATQAVAPVTPSQKTPEKPALKSFPDAPQFVVDCRFDGQPFSISFQSKSGKAENNDMAVSLLFEKSEVPITVTPAWYHAVDSSSALPSHCDGVPAFRVEGTQQFLLVLNVDQRIDGKKSDPETTLVLIDLKSKRILSKLERIGKVRASEPQHYNVLPAENGFQIRLVRDPVKGVEDWKWVIIRKGSMTAKWMRSNKKPKQY